MFKLKKDKYKSARGGSSKLLDIGCNGCGEHLCFYQKDGPGELRRMYFDRVIGLEVGEKELVCGKCQKILAVKMVYAKEKRDAYRLFSGLVSKKAVSVGEVDD